MGNFAHLALLFLVCVSPAAGVVVKVAPSKAEKKTGETFVITCKAELSITEAPSSFNSSLIQWYKIDGGRDVLIGSTGRVLSRLVTEGVLQLLFNTVEAVDAGDYKCVYGSESAPLNVLLYKKVAFIDAPTEQHPVVGQKGVIKCRAEGHSYTSWWQDGKPVAENGGRLTVTDDGDLIIPDFSLDQDNGVYTCEAIQKETGDTARRDISVTGYVTPSGITVSLTDNDKWSKGVHEGAASVKLTCTASGVPAPTYKWYKDNELINGDDHYSLSSTGVLEISQMRQDDKGNYRCNASNDVGFVEKDMTVSVYRKPTIQKIEAAPVTTKMDVTVPCHYDGDEELKASWVNYGEPIPVLSTQENVEGSGDVVIPRRYVVVDGKTATLHIKDVKTMDAGEYQCHVTNDADTVRQSMTLQVHQPPDIISSTKSGVRGILANSYDLFCEVSAIPTAKWSWWKQGGGPINPEPDHIDIKVSPDSTNSTLTIVPVSDADFATYVCSADNGVGKPSQATIELIKIVPPSFPPLVCGTDAAAPKATSITLTWPDPASVQEQQRPTSIQVMVFPEGSSTAMLNLLPPYAYDGKYKISNLEPSTNYKFNVSAINEAGASEWIVLECKTSDPTPPSAPVFEKAGTFQCDSPCVIKWSMEDNGGRPINKYIIQYGKENQELKETTSKTSEYPFNDLEPSTTYVLRVAAHTEIGRGLYSETKFFTSEMSQSVTGTSQGSLGPGAGAIVGIVIIIVLIIVVLVDVACYYVNQCGLLMCICVNLCGKTPPAVKEKEIKMEEGGAKETRFEEKHVLREEVFTEKIEGDANEVTPMIETKTVEKSKNTTV